VALNKLRDDVIIPFAGRRSGDDGNRDYDQSSLPSCAAKPPPHGQVAAWLIVRIALGPRERHDFVKLGNLSDNLRIKRGGPFMQLKAYAIDGERLRTGAANFSTSGENAQAGFDAENRLYLFALTMPSDGVPLGRKQGGFRMFARRSGGYV